MSELIQSLGKVSEIWLDPNHPLREETIQALQVSTGFSRRQIDIALTNCFEELTRSKIESYVNSCHPLRFLAGDPSGRIDPPPKTAGDDGKKSVFHILPSNVFTAWVHGAVITLLLGHRCLLKPSTREPVFARAWKKSLEEVNSDISRQVEIVSWEQNKISQAQAVIAYGSDESIQKIRSSLSPNVRFAGYGHKLSIGIIFEEALAPLQREQLLARIRRDAEPFRLQGCLSPQILYIENGNEPRWPELEAVLDAAPKIRPFAQWKDLQKELDKFNPYLSCVGYAGSPERGTYLAEELQPYGVSRVCPMGQMQCPPLFWQNGGINLTNLLN